MRTRLILAEGANHVQINPPSNHSRLADVYTSNALKLLFVLEALHWQRYAGVPAASRSALACTSMRADDAHDHHQGDDLTRCPPMVCIVPKRLRREISTVLLTAKPLRDVAPLWQ